MAITDFAGEFSCTLDPKNRVNIPSFIRKIITPDAESTIVFTRGFEGINLYAYPLNEWQRLMKKVKMLDPFDPKTRDFIRLFVGPAQHAVMDNQGRVLIMLETLKMAKIEKDMLIVGSLTKLEIWNPQVYQEYMNNMNMTLSDLAQEISFKDMFFDE